MMNIPLGKHSLLLYPESFKYLQDSVLGSVMEGRQRTPLHHGWGPEATALRSSQKPGKGFLRLLTQQVTLSASLLKPRASLAQYP